MDRRIFAAEVSHENASVQVLEQLAFPEHEIAAILTELKEELDEVFIITTRDRFAVYCVGNDITPVVKFFARLRSVSPYVRYLTNTENAVYHLFATAAGLYSRVKGEHQILAQIRDAYLFALDHQSIGIVLDVLLRKALCAGKRVHTETGIDKFCTSVPPNFDDALRHHPKVEPYNLDDLKAMVESPLDGMGGIAKAWEVIREETYRVLIALRPLQISSVPTIRDWLAYTGNCELEELNRKLNGVSRRNKELIEKYAHKLMMNISKAALKISG